MPAERSSGPETMGGSETAGATAMHPRPRAPHAASPREGRTGGGERGTPAPPGMRRSPSPHPTGGPPQPLWGESPTQPGRTFPGPLSPPAAPGHQARLAGCLLGGGGSRHRSPPPACPGPTHPPHPTRPCTVGTKQGPVCPPWGGSPRAGWQLGVCCCPRPYLRRCPPPPSLHRARGLPVPKDGGGPTGDARL